MHGVRSSAFKAFAELLPKGCVQYVAEQVGNLNEIRGKGYGDPPNKSRFNKEAANICPSKGCGWDGA